MIPVNSNLPWLEDRTILYVVTGSRAYGTHREDSDYDYGGICIPPAQYREGFLQRFDQAEFGKKGGSDIDATIYSIHKYFKLAADCNPNILEIIWAPEDCLVVSNAAGNALRHMRHAFLSKKALHTYRGYSMSQLKRIKTHRRWLLNPPAKKPERGDFGLPEFTVIPADQLSAAQSIIQKKLDSWEIDFGDLSSSSIIYIQEQIAAYLEDLCIGHEEKYFVAGNLKGYSTDFLEYLNQEKRYKAALNEWSQYHEWKQKRNPKRAAMEAQFGFDGKFAYHLIRLMRMCREILTQQKVIVRRPDAELLKSIMNGAWTYDELLEYAEREDADLVEVAKTSSLPREPNRTRLDELCCQLVRSTVDKWAR